MLIFGVDIGCGGVDVQDQDETLTELCCSMKLILNRGIGLCV